MRFEMPKDFVAEFKHRQFDSPMTVLLTNGHEITPRGFTYCILKTKSGVVLREGLAWCRDSDQFNKAIGRQISLGRALKSWYKQEPSQSPHPHYFMTDPRRKPFLRNLEKLSDDAPKLKSTGSFTLSAPDGRKTEPIPYDATMPEIRKAARKVGLRVEEVWGNV